MLTAVIFLYDAFQGNLRLLINPLQVFGNCNKCGLQGNKFVSVSICVPIAVYLQSTWFWCDVLQMNRAANCKWKSASKIQQEMGLISECDKCFLLYWLASSTSSVLLSVMTLSDLSKKRKKNIHLSTLSQHVKDNILKSIYLEPRVWFWYNSA